MMRLSTAAAAAGKIFARGKQKRQATPGRHNPDKGQNRKPSACRQTVSNERPGNIAQSDSIGLARRRGVAEGW